MKLKELSKQNEPLGIIAYSDESPVGWCSVSPKETLLQMKNSRLLKHTHSDGCWSIICLYIKKEFRKNGVSIILIKEAADYAFRNGAKSVEAYPIIPKKGEMPDVFAFTGIWKAFKKANFITVQQPSETRMIMRLSK